jgi:quercetin dioxygenase-like cupin family protein
MVTESSSTRLRITGLLASVAVSALLLSACGGGSDAPAASASGSASAAAAVEGREVLLEAQELTTLDQQIAYPKKKAPAQVSSYITTLEPGQETGWHRHRVPLFVYVLEGTVSVEYDAGVIKDYPAGSAFMEAEDIWHNGTNKGDDAVRILTVYMGASGAKNTVERSP